MRLIGIIIVFAVIVAGSVWYFQTRQQYSPASLRAIKQSLPISTGELVVNTPLPNQKITSPLIVSGQAKGNWFFEASFPVKLLDANGQVLAQTPAQAQGEWMTDAFVQFQAVLNFSPPATATGTLILKKDNPSGLPQNAGSVEVPVNF